MSQDTTKVTVALLGFPYSREVETATGTAVVAGYGRRGQKIEVNDADLDRGKRLGAFEEFLDRPGPEVEAASAAKVVDMSDDELDVWFEESEPTVQQVIDAAEDAEDAQRLLDAEERTSGGDPRKGVTEGLNKILE